MQNVYHIAERTDTRKNQLFGRQDVPWAADNFNCLAQDWPVLLNRANAKDTKGLRVICR